MVTDLKYMRISCKHYHVQNILPFQTSQNYWMDLLQEVEFEDWLKSCGTIKHLFAHGGGSLQQASNLPNEGSLLPPFSWIAVFPLAGMPIAFRCSAVVTYTLRARCTARQDVWSCRCPLSKLDGYGSFCLFQWHKNPKSSKCTKMPHAKTLRQTSCLEVQQLACKAARISRHIHLLAEILRNAGPKRESDLGS